MTKKMVLVEMIRFIIFLLGLNVKQLFSTAVERKNE